MAVVQALIDEMEQSDEEEDARRTAKWNGKSHPGRLRRRVKFSGEWALVYSPPQG